jgi:hypothetical protein
MVIFFKFYHTRLGNNIDLGWLLATRTKQRWMTRLVTSLVTFMLLVTSRSRLLPSLEIIVATVVASCLRSHNSEPGECRT